MSLSVIAPMASLADQAFERLVAAIEAGDFEPGQLIREAAVARQLGISRGSLREATVRLAALKLVDRIPNIGIRVVQLSAEDLRDLYNCREALEGMACRLAALEMSDEEIANLELMLERQAVQFEAGEGARFPSGADEDFHRKIFEGSRSRRLIRALRDELYYQLRMYRARSWRAPGRSNQVLVEHRKIVQALKRRSAEDAEMAMREHIRNSFDTLIWVENALSTAAETA